MGFTPGLRSPGGAVNFQGNHVGRGAAAGEMVGREGNACNKSADEPLLQNEQGGLGGWIWETGSARAAGLSLPVSRETVVPWPGFREGRGRGGVYRLSWSPQWLPRNKAL